MKSTFIMLMFIALMGSCDNSNTEQNDAPTNEEDKVAIVDNMENADNEPNSEENNDEAPKEKSVDDKKASDHAKNEGDIKIDPSKKSKKTTTFTDLPDLTPTSKDFPVSYLMGKFNPKTHADFTTIKTTYASRGGMYLRKDAYNAFIKMYNAAKQDGINLKIISATRPFSHQKSIWEAKWQGKRKVNGRFLPAMARDPKKRALLILQYSSMPGTSRHHWGTDIDLNDLNNSYFAKGTGKKIYDWLTTNASKFGYCQVYSPKGDDRPWGYNEEKWHWSYLPVAKKLTQQYKSKIKDSDISGFEGSETATEIGMIEKYVLGINKDCK